MNVYSEMIEPIVNSPTRALTDGGVSTWETGRPGLNIQTLIIGCLLMAAPLLARDSTDVIVMKNGDHLTGEIKGLSQGVLYMSMKYILGTSDVQWSHVDHVESKQLFLVKTEDGMVYTGTLSTAEASAGRPMSIEVVETPEEQVTLELHQVLKFVFRKQLKPVIDRVYPLAEIRAAHERLENKEHFGKVIVRP